MSYGPSCLKRKEKPFRADDFICLFNVIWVLDCRGPERSQPKCNNVIITLSKIKMFFKERKRYLSGTRLSEQSNRQYRISSKTASSVLFLIWKSQNQLIYWSITSSDIESDAKYLTVRFWTPWYTLFVFANRQLRRIQQRNFGEMYTANLGKCQKCTNVKTKFVGCLYTISPALRMRATT